MLQQSALPPRAGLGLKAAHYAAVLHHPDESLWVEVHPENYMIEGGPRLAWLSAIRERHALSFHGVGASLGGPDQLDQAHLLALKHAIGRFEPASVSEHATWSAARGKYYPDLFPLPRTDAALRLLCDRIDRFQTAIGRTILIENPSVYIPLRAEMDEPDFLGEICRRTGCGLLLDVNNVYVSAVNTGASAEQYIDAVSGELVGEIHLAGHEQDGREGASLLIDTHGAEIDAKVWALFERLMDRIGPRPTLIERDANIPTFAELLVERERADGVLAPARAAA